MSGSACAPIPLSLRRKIELKILNMLLRICFMDLWDAISVRSEKDTLEIKLIKPFNKRERKFPPGLLNPQITLCARTPGVGITSWFHSNSKASRFSGSERPKIAPEKPKVVRNTLPNTSDVDQEGT